MHHEIGSGRKYFEPIHRRVRAVLHLDPIATVPGSRCRRTINLFFSIGTDWPPLAQPARSTTHNTATWDLRSGRRASYRMPFEHRRWQSIVHIQTSLTDMRERVVHVCSSVNCLPRDSSSTLSVATLHHPIYRRVLTSSYATVEVGRPCPQSERPLPTAFQFPCPNPTEDYSRRDKTKHKSRTAAVIWITKLDQATNTLTRFHRRMRLVLQSP